MGGYQKYIIWQKDILMALLTFCVTITISTIMASKAELISNINVFAEITAFDCYLPIISEKRRVAHVIEFP